MKTLDIIKAAYHRMKFLVFHVLRHKEGRNRRVIAEVLFTEYYEWD